MSSSEITSDTTIMIECICSYYIIDASGGNIVVTLPDVSINDGIMMRLQRKDGIIANSVTIETFSGQTFQGGSTTYNLSSQFAYLNILCIGGVWYIIYN